MVFKSACTRGKRLRRPRNESGQPMKAEHQGHARRCSYYTGGLIGSKQCRKRVSGAPSRRNGRTRSCGGKGDRMCPRSLTRQLRTKRHGKGAILSRICTRMDAQKGEATARRDLAQSQFLWFQPPGAKGRKLRRTSPDGLNSVRLY